MSWEPYGNITLGLDNSIFFPDLQLCVFFYESFSSHTLGRIKVVNRRISSGPFKWLSEHEVRVQDDTLI